MNNASKSGHIIIINFFQKSFKKSIDILIFSCIMKKIKEGEKTNENILY